MIATTDWAKQLFAAFGPERAGALHEALIEILPTDMLWELSAARAEIEQSWEYWGAPPGLSDEELQRQLDEAYLACRYQDG